MDHPGRFRPGFDLSVLPPEIHVQTRVTALGRLVLPVLFLVFCTTGLSGQADQAPDQAPSAAPAPPAQAAPQGQAPPALPDSIQQMLQEFRSLQNELASLQDEAIQQSDELQAQRDDIQETIESAMAESNPEIEDDIARMEELQQEMTEAREAQDQQQMMALSQEAGQLRGRLQSAQSAVMQRPAVQEEIQTFQDNLLDEMIALNPEAEDLVDELETLSQQLQEFQRSQQGPAPAAPPQAAPQGN